MRVDFKQVEELIGERVAVHCDTEEKAKDLLRRLHTLGGKWATKPSLLDDTSYEVYEKETCYNISNLSELVFGSVSTFEFKGFRVFNYEITEEEEDGLKVHELIEGVEYGIVDTGYENEDFNIKVRVMFGVLQVKSKDSENGWADSRDSYNYIKSLRFKELDFSPGIEERYYYPNHEIEGLSKSMLWLNDEIDNRIKRNVGVYRTRELAIEKAKEMGWS